MCRRMPKKFLLDSGYIPKIVHGGNVNIQNLQKNPTSKIVVLLSSSYKPYPINNIKGHIYLQAAYIAFACICKLNTVKYIKYNHTLNNGISQ